MEFRALGPLEVYDGDRPVPLRAAKQRALLAVLLVNANEVVSSDRLIDELWGERAPDTAATALQVYVSKLRKALPEGRLVTRAPGYVLQVAPDEFDVYRFESLVAEGRAAAAQQRPQRTADVLREALSLWRGPPLAEFGCEPFAQAEIIRLEELRLAALEERIEADLALGRHAELVPELEAAVTRQPLRERLRRQLMLALYRSGRQAEALEAYRKARQVLVAELGIEPGPALQRLEKAILGQDADLDLVVQPPPDSGAERTEASVIFADLGLERDDEADAEAARAYLERVYDAAAGEIAAASGTVQEGIADALLATFDARSAGARHAQQALDAALATRERLVDLFGERLALRLGIESGEVLVGGRHGGGSFVSGGPVTSAARLVRAARPGEILVGPGAAAAVGDEFELAEHPGARLLLGRRAEAAARERRIR
jgi:DNA-binding SARP family transcriptional activator